MTSFISSFVTTSGANLSNSVVICPSSAQFPAKLCCVHNSLPENTPPPLSFSKGNFSRRTFVKHVFAPMLVGGVLIGWSQKCDAAKSISSEELASILTTLLNLRDSLDSLQQDIEQGTNYDIRRIVRTLQKGYDINSALRRSVPALPTSALRDQARLHGREASEYLNQVVDYFDATSLKARPPAEALKFSLLALGKSRDELDLLLKLFPSAVVDNARTLVNGS